MMQQKQLERFFTIVAIAILFFCSYRAFAPLNTPDLNADRAIHVLMAADLKLPQDLYYWGQNRLGSIVPLLSAGVLTILPLSPVVAVSLVQYGLLLVGYLCFASLLRHNLSKVILAFVWFLPLPEFIELVYTGQPYAAQLAFLGMAIVLLNHLLSNLANLNQWQKHGLIVTTVLCLTVSLWASDFTVVTIGLLLWLVWNKTHSPLKVNKAGGRWHVSWNIRPELVTVMTTAFLGLSFIVFAKVATDLGGYSGSLFNFNSPTQVRTVMLRLATSLVHTLTFQTDPFKTVAAVLLLVALGYAVYLLWQQRLKRTSTDHALSEWFYVLGANAVLSVGMLILSQWVYQNDVNFRYFVVAYVSGWMAVLLLAEALTPVNAKRVQVLLLVAAIAGSLALPRYVFAREKPPATVETFRPLAQFAPAGVIGDYWMSYNVCSTDPTGLSCTPHDNQNRMSCSVTPLPLEKIQGVRCDRCAERALAADRILLAKHRWFDQFPDQTTQFGQCLVRVGEPFSVNKYQFALYYNRTRQQTNAVGQRFPTTGEGGDGIRR